MANVQLAIDANETSQVILAVPGVQGPTGSNLPSSGTTHQVLFKQSNTNYDYGWKLITNDNVDAAAAIAGTKISPNFGSQTIQTTGLFSHALGTAGAPTITFTGDVNTGIYSPGADQVAISTSGTGRLFVDASGKVGIGTSSPSYIFDVQQNTADTVSRLLNTSTTTNSVASQIISGNNGATQFQIDVDGLGSVFGAGARIGMATNHFLSFTTNNSERLRITSDGNVGIGTSSPSAKTEIASSGSETSLILRNTSSAMSSYSELKFAPFTGTTAASAAIRATYTTDNNSRIEFRTTDVNAEPVERLRITSDGKVGIGTSSPGAKLDIVGGADNIADASINASSTGTYGHTFRVGNDFSSYLVKDNNGELRLGRGSSSIGGGSIAGIGNGGLALSTSTDNSTYSERLRITSDGKVGIGTASVSNAMLHVSSPVAAAAIKSEDTGGAGSFVRILGDASSQNLINWKTGTSLRFASSDDNYGSFAERLRITSDGNVGIGTSAPGSTLHLLGAPAELRVESTTSSDGFIRFTNTSGSMSVGMSGAPQNIFLLSDRTNSHVAYQYVGGASGAHIWFTNNAERARLDSTGRLLVGTSTSTSNIRVGQKIASVATGGSDYGGLSLTTYAGTNFAVRPILDFQRSRGTTDGSLTTVASGDLLGTIVFRGSDGTNFIDSAYITGEVDGTPGANDMPGRLVFSTTADGASSPTEAMRINNQRELLIGTTTRTANGGVLQISNGITFPGTQSACSDPNTLDDYEEGTWTPVAAGITTAGTATYSAQTGRYTKVGTMVYFWGSVYWTSGDGTGNLRIGGLPFTAINSNVRVVVDLTTGSTVTPARVVFGDVVSGLTSFYVYNGPTDGSATTNVTYSATGNCIFSGFYQA